MLQVCNSCTNFLILSFNFKSFDTILLGELGGRFQSTCITAKNATCVTKWVFNLKTQRGQNAYGVVFYYLHTNEAIEVKGRSLLNFEAATFISESLAANLEKVRQTSVWQTVPKFYLFDFVIFLFALLTRTSLWGTIQKTNKSELWNRLLYRGLPYIFWVKSRLFRVR